MQECIEKSSKRTTRAEKAQALFKSGVRPIEWSADCWTVKGSKGEYTIKRDNDVFTCNCPDGLYRSHQGELCKHILLVQLFIDWQRDVARWAVKTMVEAL
jgi:hypothetical protein